MDEQTDRRAREADIKELTRQTEGADKTDGTMNSQN
jgi:hypothetical protein